MTYFNQMSGGLAVLHGLLIVEDVHNRTTSAARGRGG